MEEVLHVEPTLLNLENLDDVIPQPIAGAVSEMEPPKLLDDDVLGGGEAWRAAPREARAGRTLPSFFRLRRAPLQSDPKDLASNIHAVNDHLEPSLRCQLA